MENAREHARLVVTAAAALMTAFSATGARAQVDETSPQIAQQRQYTFSIPAQPLTDALASFGRQSGMQVSIDGDVARGVASPGVSGLMTPEQALTRLLAGTGITFRLTGNTAMLQRVSATTPGAIQLDPLQIQGYPVPQQALIDNLPPPYAGGQVAMGGQLGLLGNRGVMDTPFNQTSYTAKRVQEQQAKTVRDVLLDDPSVRILFPDGGPGAESFYIRGFNASALGALSYGGLYGMLPAFSIMSELAERVEVLKGPSAMLNGMQPGGSIGGTVNIVPKRAPDEPLTQATAGYGSNAQFGGAIDVARRFGDDKQFGIRFNGVFKAGQTAVNNNSDQRELAVLGLDFRGDHVRLSADVGYQYQYIGGALSYLGLANGVPLPYAPSARINQGQPWAYNERKDSFAVVRAEVDMTERVTAYAAFGIHDSRWEGLYNATVNITKFNGAATATAPFNSSQARSYMTGEIGVRAQVETGPIAHEIALNATTYGDQSNTGAVVGTAFASNIYNPTVVARPNIPMPNATKLSTQSLSSIGFADTLSAVDKRVQLTVGARLQQVTAANFNGVSGLQTSGYDQSAISPSVALVYKPWQNISLYGNFIQGLQQGATVGVAFANAGEALPPYKSTQYEVGIKADWGKVTTTMSLFQISQPSILTNVATNTQYLGGEQRNQGLELNVFGEPLPGVRLLGGVMLLNAVLTKTQNGATDGWTAPFSPGVNLNLGGEWDLPFVPGLTVNGRMIYTGSQYVDTTSPRRSLPDWTRFDIGASYRFDNPGATGKPLVARFAVENLLDTSYWAGGSGVTTLFLGSPRTFRLSLTADF